MLGVKAASLGKMGTHTIDGSQHSDVASLTEAKGDILVYNGSTWNKLAVGTNNYVLIADSSESTGLKWAADVTIAGDLTVSGDTVTANVATYQVEDKNMTLNNVGSPSDSNASGGGITVKGTSDKTITFTNSTGDFDISENIDIASGKTFKINGTSVLSNNTLGSGVTASSLTSVGTIATGTWQGTAIALAYGGTGLVGATDGKMVVADGSGAPVAVQVMTANDGTLKHEVGGIEADISAIAKGGLVVGTGTGSMAVKAVGTDDYVLTAASGQTGGVTGGAVGGATKFKIDSGGDTTIAGGLTTGSTSALNSSGEVAVAAQPNITSLGTLTALTVDQINLNAGTLTITDSSDTGDKVTIVTTTHGATTVTTIDNGDAEGFRILDGAAGVNVAGTLTASGDITMAADKSLNLPQGANVKFTDAITQDSIDDHDAQGIIMTFQAGSTITPFSPVYLHTDDEVHECDADSIATMPCIGVSINTSNVADGSSIEVMMLGLIRDESFTDFATNGAPVYVSTTVGTMTNTAPSGEDDVVQVIGHSVGEKLLFVQPCLTTIEHAA
jgi:hypothetical protein